MQVSRTVISRTSLILFTLLVVGCTTTTRSVNESPRDPQLQRQPQQQTPSRPPRQEKRRRASAQTLSSAQMDRLVQAQVDQFLQRGVTSSQQVVEVFGQPHSMTRSGEELYWNYTHQFRDEERNVGGMKSLTILFDEMGRVQDYDFQDNTFDLE